MGAWVFRKPEASHIQGICVICETNPQKRKGDKYKAICRSCELERWVESPKKKKDTTKSKSSFKPATPRKKKFHYSQVKKDTCEMCNFNSVYKCQFDVDHIDGNHSNNNLDNLQTLCANCHRLKTHLNGDHKKKKPQGN